jgi:hypothetical protein
LAQHALSVNQLDKLARVVARLRSDGRPLDALTPFRLGMVGTGTLDLAASALIATALRYGIALDLVRGEFGQAV